MIEKGLRIAYSFSVFVVRGGFARRLCLSTGLRWVWTTEAKFSSFFEGATFLTIWGKKWKKISFNTEFERNFEAYETETCTQHQMITEYESCKQFQSHKLEKTFSWKILNFSSRFTSWFWNMRNNGWMSFRMGGSVEWVPMKNTATKYHL